MAGIAGAAVLNDRQRFRGFFRTLPSFEFVGPALAEIAREYMWTQMAIITQKESLFTLVNSCATSPSIVITNMYSVLYKRLLKV